MIAFLPSIGADIVGPIVVFAIPLVAIVGGITAGIVRTISRHRIIELAQRERIAMIERGLDPSKLPPLPALASLGEAASVLSPEDSARHRAQALMIGGFVTLAVGVSLGVMLYFIADEAGVWAVGLIPAAVGLALLISGMLIRPRGGSGSSLGSRVG